MTKRIITIWKIRFSIVAATIAAASVAFATPIPKVSKAVLTADGKAIIEVVSAGSDNTLYMYQVAESGHEADCKSTSDAKEIKGCRAVSQGRNVKSFTSKVINKNTLLKYRVLAFDPSGANPKNSGWSSWQTLYVVSGIKPQGEVKKGQRATFSLDAKGNSPSTLKFTLQDCVSNSSNSFDCTPQLAGSKQWTVVDRPGGVALAKGSINVQDVSNGYLSPIASQNKVNRGQDFNVYLGKYNGVNYNGWHSAEDWSVKSGSPILAIADGTVVKSSVVGTRLGQMLIIKHAGGVYSAYTHIVPRVKQGAAVKKGQDIARLDGSVKPVHLHWEVRKGWDEKSRWWDGANSLGYYPNQAAVLGKGFVNPSQFVEQNK